MIGKKKNCRHVRLERVMYFCYFTIVCKCLCLWVCVHVSVCGHALLINRPQEAVIFIYYIYFLTFSSKSLRRLFTILVLHTEFELCLHVLPGPPSCEAVFKSGHLNTGVLLIHVCVCVCVWGCYKTSSNRSKQLHLKMMYYVVLLTAL